MPLRNAAARRARERAQHALHSMPISDDGNLLKLQGQAEEYLREAKRRNPPEQDVSSVIDAIARDYFRAFVQKRRKLNRRIIPIVLMLSVMTFVIAPTVAHTPYDGPRKVTVFTAGRTAPDLNNPSGFLVATGKSGDTSREAAR